MFMNLRDRCRRLWEGPEPQRGGNPFAWMLDGFSLLYRCGVVLRNDLYDRGRLKSLKLPCKVISVGNLTVGGTGKTPMVILLARMLKAAGYRPAVLSRGYGRQGKEPIRIVSDGISLLSSPLEGGDEPVLIAESVPGVPVLTGPDRCLTGRTAVERLGAEVLILDDGFQHRRLFRDLNIVLLDSERPWGNGCLLPRGPLREPPAEALKRADILIRTGKGRGGPSDRAGERGRNRAVDSGRIEAVIPGHLPEFQGFHQPCDLLSRQTGRKMGLRELAGKRICAFAGLGAPEQFRRTLQSLGAEISGFLTYPDHHRYTSLDLDVIQRAAANAGAELLVTTEKDEIKLMPLPRTAIPCVSLRIEMRIEPRESFERLILERLKKNPE